TTLWPKRADSKFATTFSTKSSTPPKVRSLRTTWRKTRARLTPLTACRRLRPRKKSAGLRRAFAVHKRKKLPARKRRSNRRRAEQAAPRKKSTRQRCRWTNTSRLGNRARSNNFLRARRGAAFAPLRNERL